MPQMNPMNYSLLLVLFNLIFVLLMSKIHFFKFAQHELKMEEEKGLYKVPSFSKEI